MNLEYSKTASIYALSMSTSAQLLYRRAEAARARESSSAALVTAVVSTCNKLQGSFKRNPSLVLHVTATNPTPGQIRKHQITLLPSLLLPPPPFAGRLPSRGAEQVALAF